MNRLYLLADSGRQPRFHLPWNYHLSMSSFIYEALGEYDPEMAARLHQHQHAPPFSYSEFHQTGPYSVGDDGLSCERGYFVITSTEDTIINATANYARAHESLTVGHTTVPVTDVHVEPIDGVAGTTRYRTLSPIAVSEKRASDNGPRDWYRPDNGMWFARLCDNVRDRRAHADGISQDADHEFSIGEIAWTKPKLLKVATNAQIPCTLAEIDLTCDEETSRFIQTEGLGEKTGMGFGCMMPASDVPDSWT